jgi:hypothetical protein
LKCLSNSNALAYIRLNTKAQNIVSLTPFSKTFFGKFYSISTKVMPALTKLVPKEDKRKLALTLINSFHFLYFFVIFRDSVIPGNGAAPISFHLISINFNLKMWLFLTNVITLPFLSEWGHVFWPKNHLTEHNVSSKHIYCHLVSSQLVNSLLIEK